MSPYRLFPAFSFLERVYNDGFRIIVYKVKEPSQNNDRFLSHILYPYEAIFEEDSYVKFRTRQNPSNYVLYYDPKYIRDPEYAVRRSNTIIKNSSLVKCKVYEFNIDELKMNLLGLNKFDMRQINGTIDDLSIGVFFDRNEDTIRYDLCKTAPNGLLVRANKSIFTKMNDTKFMTMKIENKFTVTLEYVDAFECYKSETDNIDYMNLKRGINKFLLRSGNTDLFSDDYPALVKLVDSGLPLEFVYKAATTPNMVFMVEDIYRCCNDRSVYGPIYKTFMD